MEGSVSGIAIEVIKGDNLQDIRWGKKANRSSESISLSSPRRIDDNFLKAE